MTRRTVAALAVLGFAASLSAQPARKPVLGTVTQFKTDPLAVGVKPDGGDPVFLRFGPDTQVVRVPPGEHRLDTAQAAELTDILIGDRVLVSFVDGMVEARRIVLVAAGEIERRNDAERLDWLKRGISGVVKSKQENEIALEIRTLKGAHTVMVAITAKTNVRRYAPDSVKFTEAAPSSIAGIAVGDQAQVRGDQSEDGARMTSDDFVFGTFVTRVGTITAVNRDANEIEIEDLALKKPVTIKISADSRMRKMPDMRAMFRAAPAAGAGAHGAPAHDAATQPPEPENRNDLLRMIERLPAGKMDDLKVGGGVIVTGTRGAENGKVTAIMVLANADSLLQIAQKQAAEQPGKSAMEVLSGMHGGMLGGSGGLSLPAMMP